MENPAANPGELRPESDPAVQPVAPQAAEASTARPAARAPKVRIDLLLVERGLVESRERARRLILAGQVRVEGAVVDKAGAAVRADAPIEVRATLPYVSRGGLKLAAALDAFALDVAGLVAVDVGASTGGFTDCLLQRGAAQVFAVDVGYGQLAWKLRSDPRVVPIERTNIRSLEALPGGLLADLAVIDASFIGLALVLPATLRLLHATGEVVALVKPQFEAGREQVGKGGVVRSARVHRDVLERTVALADALGLFTAGITVSPAPGPAGNIEFLVRLLRRAPERPLDLESAITTALEGAARLAARTPPANLHDGASD
jgi:23S rRNA (cytidine1920-2'-O)/16S rRNA (cytidine1409-2'-O)-methyltransferase